jgi:hypothetical protein
MGIFADWKHIDTLVNRLSSAKLNDELERSWNGRVPQYKNILHGKKGTP